MVLEVISDSLRTVKSLTIGGADRAYYLVRLMAPKRPKFFSAGWGDVEAANKVETTYGSATEAPEITTEWVDRAGNVLESGEPRWERQGSMWIVRMRCPESPMAEALPESVKKLPFVFAVHGDPAAAPESLSQSVAKSTSVVVLLAATGEVGSGMRLKVAQELCDKGHACIIPTAPFYGSRMRAADPPQRTYHPVIVSDMIIQGIAAMYEAASLATWATRLAPDAKLPIVITGFSWGGAMSSGAAIMAARWNPGTAVCAAPHCGCISPAVLTEGILASDIDIEALGGTSEMDRLRAVLRHTDLGALWVPGTPQVAAVVVTGARHDAFVPADFTKELTALFRGERPPQRDAIGPNGEGYEGAKIVEQRWIDGGHAAGFYWRAFSQSDAVLRCLELVGTASS